MRISDFKNIFGIAGSKGLFSHVIGPDTAKFRKHDNRPGHCEGRKTGLFHQEQDFTSTETTNRNKAQLDQSVTMKFS